MLPEDIPVGTVVEQVKATDADFGINKEVSYRIKKGQSKVILHVKDLIHKKYN